MLLHAKQGAEMGQMMWDELDFQCFSMLMGFFVVVPMKDVSVIVFTTVEILIEEACYC